MPKIIKQKVAERSAEVSDFIDPKIKIKTAFKINPDAKLIDFADIGMVDINPELKQKIEDKLEIVLTNLKKLEGLK